MISSILISHAHPELIVEQIDPAYLRKQPLPALLRVPSVVARNLVSTAA